MNKTQKNEKNRSKVPLRNRRFGVPQREIICQDARIWLSNQKPGSLGNILTGICDLDEIISLNKNKNKNDNKSGSKFTIEQYIDFFSQIGRQIMSLTDPNGYCIFIQTDRKYQGQWIDKSYLLSKEAMDLGLKLLWHKIVLLREVGKTDLHRPTYAHMLCYSKNGKPGASFPDVIPVSERLYKNGTPIKAAQQAIEFINRYSPNKIVIDPFVGQGTIPALANLYGLDAIGIDIDPKQCKISQDIYF